MNSKKLKILLVDDHALVRSGIRLLLTDEPDIGMVGEADTATQALQQVRSGDWDVVIMDINMPGQNALDVLQLIKYEKPELPVLILTMYSERQYALRALKDGASGFITKVSAPDTLISAIRKVVEGGAYVSPTLALLLAENLRVKPKETLYDLLSEREFSVLCAIAEGKHLSEIGSDLHLSAKTITTYRARVLSKLGMQTNTELVRYALGNNLIT
jgi:two-component system, NarL family, invasion response regulator UvrY